MPKRLFWGVFMKNNAVLLNYKLPMARKIYLKPKTGGICVVLEKYYT